MIQTQQNVDRKHTTGTHTQHSSAHTTHTQHFFALFFTVALFVAAGFFTSVFFVVARRWLLRLRRRVVVVRPVALAPVAAAATAQSEWLLAAGLNVSPHFLHFTVASSRLTPTK